jgi:hypothetical protein
MIVWSFGKVCTVGAQRSEWRIEKKLIEWICPCNISYVMQMKEKICLTREKACFSVIETSQFTFNQNVEGQAISWKGYVYHVFWNSQGVLLAHFQKMVKMWILHHTVKFYWSFRMQFAENVQPNWQKGYCFIMTMPGPIQPEEPRREFKNYSGNFHFTARTWLLGTCIYLVH